MKTLKPIQINASDESLERYLKEMIRHLIFMPLARSLGLSKIMNSVGLIEALLLGTIEYNGDKFIGSFSAEISKELQDLGAKWDSGWVLASQFFPAELTIAIQRGQQATYQKAIALISALNKIDPDKIAEEFVVAKFFDKNMFYMEKDFQSNVEKITIAPELTPERSAVMKLQYQDNIRRSIKDLTAEQTMILREKIQKHVLAGGRAKALEKPVQDYLKTIVTDSFGTSLSRAKFIARQETKLAMSTYTYDRYKAAGIKQYKWRCVAGTINHPVRPMHKRLNGTIQSFDDPPITDDKGNRNNPQEDFNCRCTAIPIIPSDA